MTHTPGPWRWEANGDGFAVCFTDGCATIYRSAQEDVANSLANARLIAAAPDLLRACELALAHVPRSDDAPDGGIHGLMERAIAKAKGE